jgi:two-component system response regulator MprA
MGHVRVLVVDDDSAVRRSLSTALGRDGYEVLAADGGSAALAHLAATSVDAMVLDVAMPEPNGLEVCRRLRARGDRTPILMLTARDLVDDRVAGLDAGADDYLVKPFALAELRARLRALLRRNAAGTEQLSHGDTGYRWRRQSVRCAMRLCSWPGSLSRRPASPTARHG